MVVIPLIELKQSGYIVSFKTAIINKKAYIVPTAEQMIGWLERQGLVIIDTFIVTDLIYDHLSWYSYRLRFPWGKEKYNEIDKGVI